MSEGISAIRCKNFVVVSAHLLCANTMVGALAATVAGHLPLGVNDNLTIPVVSGLVMALMSA